MKRWILIHTGASGTPGMFTRYISSIPHGRSLIIAPLFTSEYDADKYAEALPGCTSHEVEIPDSLFKIPNDPVPSPER